MRVLCAQPALPREKLFTAPETTGTRRHRTRVRPRTGCAQESQNYDRDLQKFCRRAAQSR